MAKVVTLGEVLIRYSTVKGQKLGETNNLLSFYGGSEPNVAIGLSGLGHKVSLLSAVPENPLGYGALDNLKKYGVNTSDVQFSGERLGAYFVETGAGIRPTSVMYDRKNSSISEIKLPEEIKQTLFKNADIFHVSGITPALSNNLLEMTIELMTLARNSGVLVSFDSNYRGKLWTLEQASSAYKQLLPLVDYLSASKLDGINLMGIEEKKFDGDNDIEELKYYYEEMKRNYSNLKIIYSTLREVISTDENYLTGTLWDGNSLYVSKKYHIPYIVDRIGGGDSFSAGVLHGLLSGEPFHDVIEFATGMSVLKHTYEGDSLYIRVQEVDRFIRSNSSKIIR